MTICALCSAIIDRRSASWRQLTKKEERGEIKRGATYHCNEIAAIRALDLALALALGVYGGASALLKRRGMTIRGERGELWCGG